MNILVLNIGSSTIKYAVFSGTNELLRGTISRVKDFSKGLHKVEKIILENKIKIDAVGHRVVHGGSLNSSKKINKKIIDIIKSNEHLAPLHNPNNLKGIRIAMKLFNVPQAAVFDTAFHSTMPEKAFTYAIPKKLREKHKIRRYGFHGISHEYVSSEACRILNKKTSKLKIISCHLGNGCSITAIKNGKSIDTSMGFTPLEGLTMGTRSGSIDPAIPLFLIKSAGMSAEQVDKILNKKSGLLGLSGKTNDMEILLKSKDKKSKSAIDIFCYNVIKYIGAYVAAMNGLDLIIFTAGMGENSWLIRKKIIENLSYLGVKLDLKKNRASANIISLPSSKVSIMVIHTREDGMIAKQTEKILKGISL